MKNIISFKAAAGASLILFGIFIIFHLLVILGILFFNFVPTEILWGGRIELKSQLLIFEIFSLLIQLIAMLFTLIKAKYIKAPRLMPIAGVIMWVLFVLFSLNTVGNIFAESTFENTLAIVTALLAIFALRLALEKE